MNVYVGERAGGALDAIAPVRSNPVLADLRDTTIRGARARRIPGRAPWMRVRIWGWHVVFRECDDGSLLVAAILADQAIFAMTASAT